MSRSTLGSLFPAPFMHRPDATAVDFIVRLRNSGVSGPGRMWRDAQNSVSWFTLSGGPGDYFTILSGLWGQI